MKHFKPLSLSLQKEIAQRNICLESEIDRSMDSFGFRTMLHQCDIYKQKGYPTIITWLQDTPLRDKVLVADDTILPKTGKQMLYLGKEQSETFGAVNNNNCETLVHKWKKPPN